MRPMGALHTERKQIQRGIDPARESKMVMEHGQVNPMRNGYSDQLANAEGRNPSQAIASRIAVTLLRYGRHVQHRAFTELQ